MPKLTWKEATLNHIKKHYYQQKFSIKELESISLSAIVIRTKSRSKTPQRNLDKTLRELVDLNILQDLGGRRYKHLNNTDNEGLVYKDRRSTGHIRVVNYLKKLGISCEEEKTFHDLKHKTYLRIDIFFSVLEQSVAIEYDGSQHQKAVDIWGGEKTLQEGQHRDQIKEDYCDDNNILLYRITHEDKNVEKCVKQLIERLIYKYIARIVLQMMIMMYQTLCRFNREKICARQFLKRLAFRSRYSGERDIVNKK